jgi:geranylgeranyl pyrophosphate synthase
MVREHLDTGGKAIRSRVTLHAAAALGCDPLNAIGVAAACELLHNATLVHDDIQDGDRVRRGKPAVWVTHGMPQAINVGDLLLMLPTLALETTPFDPATRWHLSTAFARRGAQTASGQALELDLLQGAGNDRASYLQAARGKSGPFFALPIEAAALCAGLNPGHARALGDAAIPLGVLFQVCDDILDLFGDKGREAHGNDLREGKVSALTTAHLDLHPEDRPALEALLRKPREETTAAEVAWWTERFRTHGALQKATALAQALVESLHHNALLRDEPRLHKLVTQTARSFSAPLSGVSQ